MILSILIPTIPERKELFDLLVAEINKQVDELCLHESINIVTSDLSKGFVTTGEKRNLLLFLAKGKYIWFIDDDDWIPEYAIKEIIKASLTNCDVMAINGVMTTDGRNPKKFYHALGNPYCADWNTGEEIYLRYPNHINPMKRSIASQIKFPDQSNYEDKAFADALLISGLLKTETIIELPIYQYRYSTRNKTY